MTDPGLMPPIEKIRPGLWSIPVPLPNNSLRYVFVYLFETDIGAYIVDAGWNTDEAYGALEFGLRRAGYGMTDVHGVMVTHIHPDHYGLAGRIREASGAWIALHPADAQLIHDRYEEPENLVERMGHMLRSWGAPEDEIATLQKAAMPLRSRVEAVRPDVLLRDGDRADVPGWDVTAIWTPGHSPGHLCFWEDAHQLLLAGDHVLPRITPNIPYHPQNATNPLSDYLHSLDTVDRYEPREVLPAHEHRFVGLHARTAELRAHHHKRFDEILGALESGQRTAWAIASSVPWSRPWDEILGFMRRAAVAEVMAHLSAMEARGQIAATPGQPTTWAITPHHADDVPEPLGQAGRGR